MRALSQSSRAHTNFIFYYKLFISNYKISISSFYYINYFFIILKKAEICWMPKFILNIITI